MLEDLHGLSDFLRQFWGLWLMILFLGVVFFAFRPKNKGRFDEDKNIIFREDDDKEQ
jgi:cytochrome c oxidase cbb3-type subunit 4